MFISATRSLDQDSDETDLARAERDWRVERMEGLPFVPDRTRLLHDQVPTLKSTEWILGILKLLVNQGTHLSPTGGNHD